MSTGTIYREVTLVTIECSCGLVFAVPDFWRDARRKDGEQFYCPKGHARVYRETDLDRAKREIDSLKQANEYLKRTKESAERSRAAVQGQLTKERKRVGNGVCPCCNRTFQNVLRHMKTQHPEFKNDQPPVLAEGDREAAQKTPDRKAL